MYIGYLYQLSNTLIYRGCNIRGERKYGGVGLVIKNRVLITRIIQIQVHTINTIENYDYG